MNMPWTNKTGLMKAIAILATLFGISTGLCGLNFIAVMATSNVTNKLAQVTRDTLFITAYAELLVMILSAAGLILVLFVATIVWARKRHLPDRE